MPTPIGRQTPKPRSREWMRDAACVGLPENWFFPGKCRTYFRAKKVCAKCPVTEECLSYALFHKIDEGLWGGLSPEERHEVLCGRA